jgi:hypothetical protein
VRDSKCGELKNPSGNGYCILASFLVYSRLDSCFLVSQSSFSYLSVYFSYKLEGERLLR